MAKTYKMINLNILIDYVFDRFYKNNLDAYITSEKAEYFIYTHLTDQVIKPNLEIVKKTNKKAFFVDEFYRYVLFYNDNKIPVILIKKRKDLKEYHIYLDQKRQSPLDGIEYTIHQMIFMEMALSRGFLPIHASAFVFENKAILVSGPSGIGKTTLAKRMNNLFGYPILNDDKPLLRIENDLVVVYGSPFSGKESLNFNAVYPLGKLLFIEKGEKNEFIMISLKMAINEILKNIFRPENEDIWNLATDIATRIIKEDKIIKYACKNDNSAGYILQKYLKEVVYED